MESTLLEEVAVKLLGLPATSRAMLAGKLIQSLEETEDEDVEKLWVELAEERLRGMLDGSRASQPAENVFRDAREKLA